MVKLKNKYISNKKKGLEDSLKYLIRFMWGLNKETWIFEEKSWTTLNYSTLNPTIRLSWKFLWSLLAFFFYLELKFYIDQCLGRTCNLIRQTSNLHEKHTKTKWVEKL